MDALPIELLHDIFMILVKPLLLSVKKSSKMMLFVTKMIQLQFYKLDTNMPISNKYLYRKWNIGINGRLNGCKNTFFQNLTNNAPDFYFRKLMPGVCSLTLGLCVLFQKKIYESNKLIALKITCDSKDIQNFPPSIKYLHVANFVFKQMKHPLPPGLIYLNCRRITTLLLKDLTKLEKLYINIYHNYTEFPDSLKQISIFTLNASLSKLPESLEKLKISFPNGRALPDLPSTLTSLYFEMIHHNIQDIPLKSLFTSIMNLDYVPLGIVKLNVFGQYVNHDYSRFKKLKSLFLDVNQLKKVIYPPFLTKLHLASLYSADIITINYLPPTLISLILSSRDSFTYEGPSLSLQYFKCNCNFASASFVTDTTKHLSLFMMHDITIPVTVKTLYFHDTSYICDLNLLQDLEKLILPLCVSLKGIKLSRKLKWLKTCKYNLHLIPKWVERVIIV